MILIDFLVEVPKLIPTQANRYPIQRAGRQPTYPHEHLDGDNEMAGDSLQIRTSDPRRAPSPEAIRLRLGELITRYAQTRAPALAGDIVQHIEAICTHPGFDGGSEDLCSYLRLKAHWRWLANPNFTVREVQ